MAVSGGEREPLILWDDAPARDFTSAYPIGNGRLGALVYLDPVGLDPLVISEDSVFEGKPRQPRADCSGNLGGGGGDPGDAVRATRPEQASVLADMPRLTR